MFYAENFSEYEINSRDHSRWKSNTHWIFNLILLKCCFSKKKKSLKNWEEERKKYIKLLVFLSPTFWLYLFPKNKLRQAGVLIHWMNFSECLSKMCCLQHRQKIFNFYHIYRGNVRCFEIFFMLFLRSTTSKILCKTRFWKDSWSTLRRVNILFKNLV